MKFYAQVKPWRNGIEIHAAQKNGERLAVAQPVVMVDSDPAIHTEPMLIVDMQDAQHLMDELWNCGLRPTEGTGSAGSLAATERHLADMRRLVFERAGVKVEG